MPTDQDTDPTTLIYRWDVDGNGDYDENVTGMTVTLTRDELAALGLADGPHTATR